MSRLHRHSWFEADARARIAGLVDAGSFRELCGPHERLTSPHLAALDLPVAFDDGVVVGEAMLDGRPVLVGAQQGEFNGGAVGEIHGAKLRGLFERARHTRPAAVLLAIDSGGVRLHEANAGLIAISELMRALLAARADGIPVYGLIGGSCGAFGGMGIVARLCDALVMSEEGRLGLSGPEVIETVKGVDEFDSKDRALVWRVTGGKLRRSLGDAALLVDDDIAAFRDAARALFARPVPTRDLAALDADQQALTQRAARHADARDGLDIWRALGLPDPSVIPMLDAADFNRLLAPLSPTEAA
ncbi:biotin-independent malonate decarboxylase subunit beta [Methyloversatilis discipulorum]|uniref:biotin-independent malonate decarboxylase subunit beta n=1 Tax=Methyloversatilis discipulorum TaxID=1119528 RepID=UPI003AF42098